MYKIIWFKGGTKFEDPHEWDSRDMAQLSALLAKGPNSGPLAGKVCNGFEIVEVTKLPQQSQEVTVKSNGRPGRKSERRQG